VDTGSIPTPASISHYENGTPTHLSPLESAYTAPIALDDTTEGLPRQMIHQLGEYQFAGVGIIYA
jgi:hypothetical protein